MGGIEDRRGAIVHLVAQSGYMSIEALAKHFAVTPQTIRRDINELAETGALQRHHGGAARSSSTENIDYASRQTLQFEGKERIAAAVAQEIPDHASLIINIGTTNEAIAKALMQHKGLRVITNNLNVAAMLAPIEDFQIVIAGGTVRARDRGIVGEATIDLIRQFRVDFAIIGISGIDLDGTLLDFDYQEVRVAQAIIENARRVFLASDISKIGRQAMARLGHIADIDDFFTDQNPPAELQQAMLEGQTRLVVAAS